MSDPIKPKTSVTNVAPISGVKEATPAATTVAQAIPAPVLSQLLALGQQGKHREAFELLKDYHADVALALDLQNKQPKDRRVEIISAGVADAADIHADLINRTA
jgi:hypothetical protein